MTAMRGWSCALVLVFANMAMSLDCEFADSATQSVCRSFGEESSPCHSARVSYKASCGDVSLVAKTVRSTGQRPQVQVCVDRCFHSADAATNAPGPAELIRLLAPQGPSGEALKPNVVHGLGHSISPGEHSAFTHGYHQGTLSCSKLKKREHDAIAELELEKKKKPPPCTEADDNSVLTRQRSDLGSTSTASCTPAEALSVLQIATKNNLAELHKLTREKKVLLAETQSSSTPTATPTDTPAPTAAPTDILSVDDQKTNLPRVCDTSQRMCLKGIFTRPKTYNGGSSPFPRTDPEHGGPFTITDSMYEINPMAMSLRRMGPQSVIDEQKGAEACLTGASCNPSGDSQECSATGDATLCAHKVAGKVRDVRDWWGTHCPKPSSEKTVQELLECPEDHTMNFKDSKKCRYNPSKPEHCKVPQKYSARATWKQVVPVWKNVNMPQCTHKGGKYRKSPLVDEKKKARSYFTTAAQKDTKCVVGCPLAETCPGVSHA